MTNHKINLENSAGTLVWILPDSFSKVLDALKPEYRKMCLDQLSDIVGFVMHFIYGTILMGGDICDRGMYSYVKMMELLRDRMITESQQRGSRGPN